MAYIFVDILVMGFVRWELEVAYVLGKVLGFSMKRESSPFIIIQGETCSFKFPTLLAIGSVPSYFDCVLTAFSILYSYLIWEDQYHYIAKWIASLNIICRKHDKFSVHIGFPSTLTVIKTLSIASH